MLLNIKLISLLYLIYSIAAITCNKKSDKSSWIKHVLKDINDNHNVYQTMLIFNKRLRDTRIHEIVHKLGQNIPSLSVSFENARKGNHEFEKLASLKDSRSTTIFIIVIDATRNVKKLSEVSKLMKFIKGLSVSRIRSKCLIIHLSSAKEKSDYEHFLRDAWINLFLDVSALDIQQAKPAKVGLIQATDDDIATLHYLNPFKNDYKEQNYSSKIQLFPNKLLDMNGYEMKVGMFNYPPYSFVERNSTGHPVKAFGSDVLISKILSSKMNFKLVFSPYLNAEHFGKFDCNKSKSTGLTYELLHNKLRFINVRFIHVTSVCNNAANDLVTFGLAHYSAAIPVIRSEKISFWVGETFLYTSISTGLIFIIVYTLSRVFKFDKRIWSYPSMIQAILSLTIPNLPRELKERIIFGCVFIISIVYSSNIYVAMTDLHYEAESEMKFSSLKELDKSNIKLIIASNVFKVMLDSEDDNVVDILKKSNLRADTVEECFAKIVKRKEFACFGRQTVEKMFMKKYIDDYGRPMIKFVPETVFSTVEGFLLEPGSPYAERFNILIGKLSSSGIFSKTVKDSSSHHISKENKAVRVLKEMSSLKLPMLLGVLLGGYAVSIMAFISEILKAKVIKFGRNRT